MNSKIYSILLAVLLSFSMPLFSCSANDLSTVVRYESPGTDYYEIDVPLEMSPGESADVYATGNWDSLHTLEVRTDDTVTLVNKDTGAEIDLNIYFDGICKVGDDSNETNVSTKIEIEDIDNSIRGKWEGVFNYSVNMIEDETYTEIIPDGGTYYVSATSIDDVTCIGDYSQAEAVYYEGDEFPKEVKHGDVYVYGDYEYRYQCGYEGIWYGDYELYNWGVTVIDSTKSEYGNILSYINGKAVDNLSAVYWYCDNIEKSPQLPATTKIMNYAFYCSSLVEPPVIPDGVKELYRTFDSCSRLKTAPVLPSSVSEINYTFADCTALETPPVIHENITDMRETFSGCTSLYGTIEINAQNISCYERALYKTNITEITGSISDELKSAILDARY